MSLAITGLGAKSRLLSQNQTTWDPPTLAKVAEMPPSGVRYGEKRVVLIQEIMKDFEQTSGMTNRSRMHPSTIAALSAVPRHAFVPESHRNASYQNTPLPIGQGQTISQPYIVALMTDLAELKPHHKVLEIGTGSGYQAAILSHIVHKGHVFSIEIVEPLHRSAKLILSKLGYRNVTPILGDGYQGLKSEAPFDAILVTAAAPRLPEPLLKQLKPGGKMIIPAGPSPQEQWLQLITRSLPPNAKAAAPLTSGSIAPKENELPAGYSLRKILPVRFVPFTGEIRQGRKKPR